MKAERKSDDKQLLMGIDLGTSRTTVMTSRGVKKVVRSVVGYPKDLIGVKLLGQPYVVGQEAFDQRSYLDLRYPLADGVLREFSERDLEIARHLLGHVIELAEPKQGDKLCAVIGVPARASASNKSLLLRMAQEVVDTALVVSEPFMVAYGLNKLINSIVIDIGAGTVDLCALKGTMPGPEDQATLLKAGNYIDERLMAAILERHPHVQINKYIACAIKEAQSFVGDAPGQVKVELRSEGKPVTVDVTEEIRTACEAIVPDIIEQMENLIQSFGPEDQAVAVQNIVIAGGGSRIRGLPEMIAAELEAYGEVRVSSVESPEYAGCIGALKLAQDLPPAYWDQLGEMVGGG